MSRAKWRPLHKHQIALAAGEQGMQVRSVVEPYVPVVVLDMGVHVKHGFCWVDTPLSPGTFYPVRGEGVRRFVGQTTRQRRIGVGHSERYLRE